MAEAQIGILCDTFDGMKHLYPLSLLVLSPLIGTAQPVLDYSTNGTLPGDAFVYQAGPWVDPGTAGADQTWDLTGLSTDSIINILFVDPATTPDGASFPSATIAASESGGYTYSEFNATGGYFHGLALTGFTPAVYSDPMQQVVFPATLGTAWTDDFGGTFDILGTTVTRTGTITAEADAYGTLQLPWGTLTDVLRVSGTEAYTDDYGLGTLTYENNYYDYLQAGTRYPIVHIFSTTTSFFGNTTTITGAQWMNGIPTNITTAASGGENLVVRIDASDRAIVVALPEHLIGETVLELLSTTGVVLQQRRIGSTDGRTVRLDAQGSASGVYLVRLTGSRNSAVGRVVLD